MIAEHNYRTIIRKVGDSWKVCAFEQLKKGDFFKLFEPDDTIKMYDNECYVVLSDPIQIEPEGNWSVECDKYVSQE